MPETTEGTDLFTQLLDALSQVVMPDWELLIRLLLPLGMAALAVLGLTVMLMRFRGGLAVNRSRVPGRRPGRVPDGIHLPGPSPWPLVAPFGGALVLLALVFPMGGMPINLPLLGLGLLVAAVAVAGWLWDAGKEWRAVEAGAHGGGHDAHAELGAGGAVALQPWQQPIPEGIHLPGPSPWPFFVPVAGGFVLLGLIFGPLLVVAGIAMALVAIVGWLRDAGREYHQVEAGHHPEPVSRDPSRAFPVSLVKVFAGIAVVAIGLTVLPGVLGALPGNAPGGGDGGSPPPAEEPTDNPVIWADSVLEFGVDRVVVPADTAFTITFENRQDGVPHDVDIRQGDSVLVDNPTITGVETTDYATDPIPAGEYTFFCSVHPPMTGTLVAR